MIYRVVKLVLGRLVTVLLLGLVLWLTVPRQERAHALLIYLPLALLFFALGQVMWFRRHRRA